MVEVVQNAFSIGVCHTKHSMSLLNLDNTLLAKHERLHAVDHSIHPQGCGCPAPEWLPSTLCSCRRKLQKTASPSPHGLRLTWICTNSSGTPRVDMVVRPSIRIVVLLVYGTYIFQVGIQYK